MKVKFLRKYAENEIGTEKVINVDEQEREYLLSTGTIEILEDNAAEEDIPKVPVDEEKAGKNGKKGSSK